MEKSTTFWSDVSLNRRSSRETSAGWRGSGQQAVQFAAQEVMAGPYDIVIAAGVEWMGRVPTARRMSILLGWSICRLREMRTQGS